MKQQCESNRDKLKKNFNGLGVNQLASVEKEFKYNQQSMNRKYRSKKELRSLDTTDNISMENNNIYVQQSRDLSLQNTLLQQQ